jgi:hypothetical protein
VILRDEVRHRTSSDFRRGCWHAAVSANDVQGLLARALANLARVDDAWRTTWPAAGDEKAIRRADIYPRGDWDSGKGCGAILIFHFAIAPNLALSFQ